MSDIISKEKRSQNMSAIRNKDTKPEVFLRKLLFHHGFRYRKYSKIIPGHPDLWLKKYNTAVFINGCFWHRHKGCKYAYIPKSREDFWMKKFERNKERDIEVQQELRKQNRKCLVIWECTIKSIQKDKEKEEKLLNNITSFLSSKEMYKEL